MKKCYNKLHLDDKSNTWDEILLKPSRHYLLRMRLTHWGRATHICVSKLTVVGSDNGLSPGWRQAIIWINDGILLIRPLGLQWNLKQNWHIFIQENAFENIVCEIAAILSRSQCVKRILTQRRSYVLSSVALTTSWQHEVQMISISECLLWYWLCD